MTFLFAVLMPLCLHLLVTAVAIATAPGGSFVGLGAMYIGLVAIPASAIVNYTRTRRKPPLPWLHLVAGTFWTTLVYPVLLLALALLAS